MKMTKFFTIASLISGITIVISSCKPETPTPYDPNLQDSLWVNPYDSTNTGGSGWIDSTNTGGNNGGSGWVDSTNTGGTGWIDSTNTGGNNGGSGWTDSTNTGGNGGFIDSTGIITIGTSFYGTH